VWPAALVAVTRLRRPAKFLIAVALALALYRAGLVLTGASGTRVYFAPDTHAEGLVLGAALAFVRHGGGQFTPTRSDVAVTAILCAPLVAFSASLPSTQMLVLPLFELAAAIFVAAAVAGTLRLPGPLIWLGGISYSLYLWHELLLWALHGDHRLLALAASVLAAAVSTRWVERPFRRRRSARLRPSLSAAPAQAG
jgi:peptidoglycan/LPS O-acetylase OafA/YrhL